jgi:hypothetical protein
MEQDISYHSCAGIILLDTLKGTGSKIKQTGMFLPSNVFAHGHMNVGMS